MSTEKTSNFKLSPKELQDYLGAEQVWCDVCEHARIPVEDEPCKTCKHGDN